MKAWLKGGLIGIGIFVGLLMIGWIVSLLLPTGEPLNYYSVLIMYPCIFFFSGESGMACGLLGPVVNLILIFVIGSLISYLIGKFKKPQNIKRGYTNK